MGIFSGPGRYMAAKNALVAKYTFERLVDDEKEEVDKRILSLLIEGGIPLSKAENHKNRLRETQYFGMAALAMSKLRIKPALTDILYKDEWEHVQNPLVGYAEKEISMAVSEVQRKHGLALSLSDVDKP